MASKSLFLVCALSCVGIVQITGQLCSPGAVQNIRISSDDLLVWEPPLNNSCYISYFLVFINHQAGESTHTYYTGRTSLLVNFLQICEGYFFTITAVSANDLVGVETQFYSKMPFPKGADLRIELFSITKLDNGVRLQWQVAEEWRNCANLFRVTLYDEEADLPVDLYVYSIAATLYNLIPCATYIMGVRAIYNLAEEGPFTSTRYTVSGASLPAPILQSLTLGRTTVDMSWELESYYQNRCQVSSFVIDASPYFKINYPITDQADRPPFAVHISGLDPDTMYIFNVTVVNSAGASTPAIIAVQTLE